MYNDKETYIFEKVLNVIRHFYSRRQFDSIEETIQFPQISYNKRFIQRKKK